MEIAFMHLTRYVPHAILGLTVIVMMVSFAIFFQQIPLEGNTLAMDWKTNWSSLNTGLPYAIQPSLEDHLPYPPWSMLPLLPLGMVSMQITWGWMSLLTLAILILSVPRTHKKWLYWLSVLLLVMSYPAIRTMVDGNPEILMVAGSLLILHGYRQRNAYTLAGGILLATMKPQTFLVFLFVLGIYILQNLPPRLWFKTAALVLVVVIPSLLWRGENWVTLMLTIPQQGSIMDISLMAALRRTEILPPLLIWLSWLAVLLPTLYVAWVGNRDLSREKAGLLIATSLLIAPYAANTLSLLAIGIIPLFHKKKLQGAVLLALAWGQLLLNQPQFIGVLAYYSTFVLVLMWGALLWHVWQEEIHQSESTNTRVPFA